MEGRKRRGRFRNSLRRMAMECLCSGEQLKGADETVRSSDSTITKDFSASGYSSRNGEIEQYLDNGNIEEAELSLREGICLNYERRFYCEARSAISETDRTAWQCEALEVLGNADKKMHGKDSRALYSLSLVNAEQRKLEPASFYAKKLVKLEAGSELRSWLLLARILSAQKQFADAETIVDAALDQTGKWSQGDLLRTKARIQAAQGQFRVAVETYTELLAIIQLRTKSLAAGIYSAKGNKDDKGLEIETWYDLALLYLGMAQWRDAEICVLKIRSISPYSALAWHATGKIYEAKGLTKEALGAFFRALDLDPKHVPSLISIDTVLRQLGDKPLSSVRCFLTDALQLDRTNHVAWFNLGLLYKEEGSRSAVEAAECFQASAFLEETAPVEPFR